MTLSLRYWYSFVCVFLCGCAPFWFLTEKHEALAWPISLEQGHFESPPFQTKFGQRRYDIFLNAKRTIPFDALGCYMGTAIIQNKCASYPNQINIRWEIWGEGRLVASGVEKGWPSSAGWTDGYTERVFGSFVARQGLEYKMKIEVLQNGVLLKPAEPTFLIYACSNPTNQYIECHP